MSVNTSFSFDAYNDQMEGRIKGERELVEYVSYIHDEEEEKRSG